MPSSALSDLQAGIAEVRLLRMHVPRLHHVRRELRHQVVAARQANRRACVVLLCSHYERYIYGLNDEITDFLNASALPSERIPERLRLLQARAAIDDIAEQQWDARASKLTEFASRHASMWLPGEPVTGIQAGPTLASMKSPKVKDVVRYFESIGIPGVLDQITRTADHRRRLGRSLQALVDSRNGIAHGDATVQPLAGDVTEYCQAVIDFGQRVDRLLARKLRAYGGQPPW